MNGMWEAYKKAFFQWEQASAEYAEKVMSNPAVLGPSGAMLSAVMRGKARADKLLASWWSLNGIPTRREQERILHSLNELHSRLTDLELDLDERLEPRPRAAAQPNAELAELRAELEALRKVAAAKKKPAKRETAPKRTNPKE